MVALVISISFYLSVKSVGSSFLRVILIDSISVKVSVAPKVGVVAVASPAEVLEFNTHSSSEADPLEKSGTEMPERHVLPTPYDAMLTRWRSRVASRSSSPTTSTLEIPTASIPIAPSAFVALSTDIISPIDAPPRIQDSVEEDIDTDVLANIEADVTTVKVAVDMDVEVGVNADIGIEVDVGVDVEERLRARSSLVIGRELEARSLIAGGERATLLDQEIGDIHCKVFGFSSMMLCMDFGLVVEPVVSSSISVNQVPHYGVSVTE
nr:hypothetical protein [Tanacetum cinerariifolium]GEW77631.1 hypothetical protein [Tanacetum cinerariifolium]